MLDGELRGRIVDAPVAHVRAALLHGAAGIALAFRQAGRDKRIDDIQTGVERCPRRFAARHVGEDFADDGLRDATIIGAAQRVEHYEIAAYGTAIAHARLLGQDEVVQLLEETLEEEKAADEKLTEVAEQIVNPDAASSEDEDEEESDREMAGIGASSGSKSASSGKRGPNGRSSGGNRRSARSRSGRSR